MYVNRNDMKSTEWQFMYRLFMAHRARLKPDDHLGFRLWAVLT